MEKWVMQINNEPVAWMSEKRILSYVNDMGFTIPLYTHPVKEITDEEIIQTYADIDGRGIVEFARAILRKAQEK